MERIKSALESGDFDLWLVVVFALFGLSQGVMWIGDAPALDVAILFGWVLFVAGGSVSALRRVRQLDASAQSEDLREALAVARRCATGEMIQVIIGLALLGLCVGPPR